MLVVRWLRSLARLVLGVVLLSPVVALPLALLLDRGPAGETRISPHFFPLVLWLFDDFAWTCARNSLIFAILVSLLALGIGGVLGWVAARRRFWGRGIPHGLVIALLTVSPAFLALGLLGLGGAPGPWPWPFSGPDGGTERVSLESWRGLPLWIVWIWSTLPWGVALVTLVTGTAVEQLEPSWEDAARLTGVGNFRAWRILSWSLVRPSSCRAAALVFVFALAEPGAPLVLGLRRTLAFQIVEAAGSSEPFPQAAVWAFMTGVFGLAGWAVWRWAGGTPIFVNRQRATAGSRGVRRLRCALLAGGARVGLAPRGMGFLWLAADRRVSSPRDRREPIRARIIRRVPSTFVARLLTGRSCELSEPPVPGILVNSLLLGLEAACAAIVLAWLTRPDRRVRGSRRLGTRLARRLAFMPPLVQGVGLLALPWLAGLASVFLVDLGQWRPLAVAFGRISTELDPFRSPWIMMSVAVVLSLVPRFLVSWQPEVRSDPLRAGPGPGFDAALIAGTSRARAGRLSQPVPLARCFAGCFLVWSLAATNLVPALLFEPWTDGRTIAPAILQLAAGSADARAQAAALALCAVASNLAALAMARVSSALPGTLDLD